MQTPYPSRAILELSLVHPQRLRMEKRRIKLGVRNEWFLTSSRLQLSTKRKEKMSHKKTSKTKAVYATTQVATTAPEVTQTESVPTDPQVTIAVPEVAKTKAVPV